MKLGQPKSTLSITFGLKRLIAKRLTTYVAASNLTLEQALNKTISFGLDALCDDDDTALPQPVLKFMPTLPPAPKRLMLVAHR